MPFVVAARQQRYGRGIWLGQISRSHRRRFLLFLWRCRSICTLDENAPFTVRIFISISISDLAIKSQASQVPSHGPCQEPLT